MAHLFPDTKASLDAELLTALTPLQKQHQAKKKRTYYVSSLKPAGIFDAHSSLQLPVCSFGASGKLNSLTSGSESKVLSEGAKSGKLAMITRKHLLALRLLVGEQKEVVQISLGLLGFAER